MRIAISGRLYDLVVKYLPDSYERCSAQKSFGIIWDVQKREDDQFEKK